MCRKRRTRASGATISDAHRDRAAPRCHRTRSGAPAVKGGRRRRRRRVVLDHRRRPRRLRADGRPDHRRGRGSRSPRGFSWAAGRDRDIRVLDGPVRDRGGTACRERHGRRRRARGVPSHGRTQVRRRDSCAGGRLLVADRRAGSRVRAPLLRRCRRRAPRIGHRRTSSAAAQSGGSKRCVGHRVSAQPRSNARRRAADRPADLAFTATAGDGDRPLGGDWR